MPNPEALDEATKAAQQARAAETSMDENWGIMDPGSGQAGPGMQHLALAIEHLALAVARLAEQQP
jgi:hypothetical protein